MVFGIGDETGQVPWNALRSDGVCTISYQTEPVGPCLPMGNMVSELWDYMWRNIDNSKLPGMEVAAGAGRLKMMLMRDADADNHDELACNSVVSTLALHGSIALDYKG